MNFDLTEEQKMIKELARKFADEEVAPGARENDLYARFPMDLPKKMAALGLLGGPIPEKYGGAGLDYICHAIITEEIGRACSSIRTFTSAQVSLVEISILKWGTEEQRLKYLPPLCKADIIGCFGLTEPNAGSDAGSLSTTAVFQKDAWVLNGTKTWISNGGIADIALVIARTGKEKHEGLTAFLVSKDAAGFSTKNIENKLGLRSSNTAELIFDNCMIPRDAILGGLGDGFKIAMSALDNGRFSVAAGCVGIGQACIDACIKYAKERIQFGKPIGNFQLVQDMIAKMVVDTEAARMLVYKAAYVKNKGLKSTLETSIAKYFASEMAMRAATDAVQIHGGYGYSNELPVERYFRDAKCATIYEGTSQIQKLIIGREVLGLKAFE
ncbi:MAG: acyl-CoA dehydrogenase family protein [Planctomycetes bacterium]|nr:acyl-CoA dehydrogenase family protein [Planctomycetota bacterium]